MDGTKAGQARDIGNVTLDPALPRRETADGFLAQVGNPYRFKSGNITVNVRFAGKCTLEEAVAHYLAAYANARDAIAASPGRP